MRSFQKQTRNPSASWVSVLSLAQPRLNVTRDYKITHSPLCRTVTDAGHTIQVEIYRGPDTGWTLEVVDAFNNSHVWNDEFPTDQAALDELFRTIRQDGIESLVG